MSETKSMIRHGVLGALALLLGSATSCALAQYKIVAPDGSITYTDRPPPGTAVRPPARSSSQAAAGTGALPSELREPTTRFPVTLYATHSCAPCDQARQWLKQRGVPFSEYSVDRPVDVTALKSRFGDAQLPVVTIGSQAIKGFSAAELESYSDAAGYPRQSRLANYAWPAAVPLAPPPQSVAAPVAPAPATPAPAPPPASRSGIQF